MLHVHTAHVISADFNLDFYTEVQDLSYLENLLSQQSPRYAALNMEICSLVEDCGLVGFETLAVEVCVRILYTLHFQCIPEWHPQNPALRFKRSGDGRNMGKFVKTMPKC